MTVALGIIGNQNFYLLFPLYFFKIYNFEQISFFRFRLPYTNSGNPFSLCKNLWAYSVEGISKCEFFFIGKVGDGWKLDFCKVLATSCSRFFFLQFCSFFYFGFLGFFMLIKLYFVNSRLLSGFLVISLYRLTLHSKVR